MLSKQRNNITTGNWFLSKLEIKEYKDYASFDCGDDDLNEFFRKDALEHKKELLTETYVLSLKSNPKYKKLVSVALISYCNDAIIFPDEERKKFLPEKKSHYKSLPAVKIARLGVDINYHGLKAGSLLIYLTKTFFIKNNRTGCRFITVDAYNADEIVGFYTKNGFNFLHEKDKNRKTRIMYFDLKRLVLQTK